MKAPFPITPQLTAVAIAYRNIRLIADDVLPRTPVNLQEFKYRKYALGDKFTIPNTLVGRTSQPNQVEFGFTEVTDSTRNYALDDPIPQDDINNAPEGYDPISHAVEGITDLILLDREVRTAALVFNADSYASANKTQLSGDEQWDSEDSDPIDDIVTALDNMIMRPNIMVLGNGVATALRRHPKIVKAYHGTLGDSGIVPMEFVRNLFELEQILVGPGWVNNARKGQAPSVSRVWGKHCSLIYRDVLAGPQARVTFGFTAQWGSRVAGSIADPDIGMRGGQRVRSGESVKELVCADDLGYFIQDAIG
jgi:hypothetical protein